MEFLEMGDPYETLKKIKNFGREEKFENPSVEIFRAQAQFLREVEDEYRELAPMEMSYPYYQITYTHMSLSQLRTYLTFRTRFKKHNYNFTKVDYIKPPYLYLFICELINNVYEDEYSPKQIMAILMNIAANKSYVFYAGKFNPEGSASKSIVAIIRAYYILHHDVLPERLEYYLRGYDEIVEYNWGINEWNVHTIEDYRGVVRLKWDDLKTIEVSADHKITPLMFYINATDEEKQKIETSVTYTLNKLSRVFAKNGINLKSLFFSRPQKPMKLFNNLIFDERLDTAPEKTTVRLNEFHRAIKNKQGWNFVGFEIDEKRYIIGYILKHIEITMRVKSELNPLIEPRLSDIRFKFFKSKTKGGDTPDWKRQVMRIIEQKAFVALIKKYVDESFEGIGEAKKPESVMFVEPVIIPDQIEIQMDKLEEIRAANEDTAMMLKTSEEIEILEQELQKEQATRAQTHEIETEIEQGFGGFINQLNEIELELIITRLSGTGHIKPDLLQIEKINEKALETIGDNLLDAESGEIYEDYIEDLQQMIGER